VDTQKDVLFIRNAERGIRNFENV